MKQILMIGTGGTIASEMTEAGLVPGMSGAEFLQYIPSVEKLCQVDCLQVCNIDSTNMTPSHWLAIAQAVETHYETYDGFVICHGTDTLAYTAAALSYLIQDSPKPIVLTGSQKPIHMDITDSKTNLLDSFTVACDGRLPGVTVVFGGAVILGTRARKTYSKSFGAFSSINYPVLGVVQEGRLVPYILPPAGPAPRFFHALNQRVSLVKLIPGLSPAYLAFALADEVWMVEHAVYSILSPEGFASILWKDSSRAREAAKVMGLTADQLKKQGMVEEVIPEETPLTLENLPLRAGRMREGIRLFLNTYGTFSEEELLAHRWERFRTK